MKFNFLRPVLVGLLLIFFVSSHSAGQSITLSSASADATVDLTWSSGNIVSAYQVYRDTDSNPAGRVRIAVTESLSYTDTDVINGTTYYYWIKAAGTDGSMVNSNVSSATPLMPSSITLSSTDASGMVNLSWSATNISSGYSVYRDTDSNPAGRVRIAVTESLNYTDTNVTNGTAYYYWIKGTDTNGLSVNSNYTQATPTGSTSTTYYIAPNGSDSNSGTSTSSPFATLQKANSVVQPGDVVYIRGGQYNITDSDLTYVNVNGTTVAEADALYACGTKLSTSGASGALIKYYNYGNETPIFNYSGVTKQKRITGIFVTASYIVLKGIEITNVPVNLAVTYNTQSECIRNFGSNNKYERLVMRDSEAVGFYLSKGSNNLIYNCDAYNIWDKTSGNRLGENSDGFGAHPTAGSTGNVFKGCRAWFCADDGFDAISAFEAVTFEECWAFYNGYSTSYARLANGNGFKSGGYGLTPRRLPAAIPSHTTKKCLAVGNRSAGFYANHHPGGLKWYSNTAYNNGVNFNMLGGIISGSNGAYQITDTPGQNMILNNNISHYGSNSNANIPRSGQALVNLDYASSNEGYNTFTMNGVSVSDADFQSLNLSQLTAVRNPVDGSLPEITTLHLSSGSDLIDAGISSGGVSYNGTSPDLGCFETGSTSRSALMSETSDPDSQISIYPNPANDYLNIVLPAGMQKGVTINIVNTFEQVVISQSNISGELKTIDISGIREGIYTLQVIKGKDVESKKFIKK